MFKEFTLRLHQGHTGKDLGLDTLVRLVELGDG